MDIRDAMCEMQANPNVRYTQANWRSNQFVYFSNEQQEFILEDGSKWDVGASILAKEDKGWTKFNSRPTIKEIIEREPQLKDKQREIERELNELQNILPEDLIRFFYYSDHEHNYLSFCGTKDQLQRWLNQVLESYDMEFVNDDNK